MSNTEKFNKKVVMITLFIVSFLGFLFIFSDSVWYDEGATIIAIRAGKIDNLLEWIANDFHPPLYYIGLKAIKHFFGDYFVLYKSFSWLSIVVMHVVVVYQFLKNNVLVSQKDMGILVSLFLCITTLQSNFLFLGTEIRMYGWTMCCVTLSGIWAYKVYHNYNLKNVVWFLLFSLSSAYCHYFGLLSEVLIYVFLFILFVKDNFKNIKKCLIISAISIIGYLPWLPFLIRQMNSQLDDFWVSVSFGQIPSFFKGIIGFHENVELLFLSFLLFYSIYELYRKPQKTYLLWGGVFVAVIYLLIISSFIIGIITHPILTMKYLYCALGLFWLGIIILIHGLPSGIKKIMTVFLICFVAHCSINAFPHKLWAEYDTGTEETIEFINNNVNNNDILASNSNHLIFDDGILRYYFPTLENMKIDEIKLDKQKNTVWYFHIGDDFDIKKYTEAGWQTEEAYTGNIDNNYYFNIYKIYK